MTYHVTHVKVVDNPPPERPIMTVGRLYALPQTPAAVFSTVTRAVEEDEEDEKSLDEAETKVVTRQRGRRPKANQDAETK